MSRFSHVTVVRSFHATCDLIEHRDYTCILRLRALYAPDALDAPNSCLSIFGEISGRTLPIPRWIKIEHAARRQLWLTTAEIEIWDRFRWACSTWRVVHFASSRAWEEQEIQGDPGRSRARSLVWSNSSIIDCARTKIDRGEIDWVFPLW